MKRGLWGGAMGCCGIVRSENFRATSTYSILGLKVAPHKPRFSALAG